MSIKKPNLVTYWIAVNGGPTKAMRLLNDSLQTDYTLSRIAEWKNARRSLPRNVQRFMLESVLPLAIASHMIDRVIIDKDKFFSTIEPPYRERKGKKDD